MSTDGIVDQKETHWTNSEWSQQWGYFNTIPDLKAAILMKAAWMTGKGFKTSPREEVILEHITGWGKDTFEDIIFNAEVIKRIAGDSYCQIIRDKKTGLLVNLKPLDPGSMVHVVGKDGRLIRYEQTSKIKDNPNKKFLTKEIFHLSHNRLADQIHGISDIKAVEKTILADNESFEDVRRIMHRQARPMIMFKLGTDDTSKISAFVKKMDEATNKGENIYIPNDKDSVDFEVIQVNMSSLIFDWRNDIRNRFYRTIGLPQVIPGAGGQSTESETKVIYFAFEQLVQMDQKKLELQIWKQLQIKIDLIPPTTLSAELQGDESKDAAATTSFQPNDTQVGGIV
jgi:hypothetical protein